jgi:hypothetical protein
MISFGEWVYYSKVLDATDNRARASSSRCGSLGRRGFPPVTFDDGFTGPSTKRQPGG